jgi:hypothetical protein
MMGIARMKKYRVRAARALVVAAFLAPWVVLTQQSNPGAVVPIDADDIGGVVTSARGPEAGVWVIAETTDLPTKFARIVVTDDQGRYVLPDLHKAGYSVWVRGYGLVDSPHVQSVPGKALNLTAVIAPDPHAAAQYYPPNYWLSLMKLPDGNERMTTTARCALGCHQMGSKSTREFCKELLALGPFQSSTDTWLRRV